MVGEVYRQHFQHTFVNPDNTNMYYFIGHFERLLRGAFPDAYARNVVPVNAGSFLHRLKIALDQ